MKIEYVKNSPEGPTALEEGLAELGRVKDLPWLVEKIETLDELEFLRLFKLWPTLADEEGVWGTCTIDPYVVMCQFYLPPKHKRDLGAHSILKVDRAGSRDGIRRRLEACEES